MPVHAQILDVIAEFQAAGYKPPAQVSIDEARLAFDHRGEFLGELGPRVTTRDVWIGVTDGEVRARVYEPERNDQKTGVVFFHGGGFCIGSIESHDRECHAICELSGALVVSIDYRMGPEHPYTEDLDSPVWIDDAWAALQWVVEHAAPLRIDHRRIALAGDSAGANIAAVLAQLARDRELAVALQVLVYPSTDMSDGRNYPSRSQMVEAPFLDSTTLRYFHDQSRPSGDLTSSLISPSLNPSLADLPPALVLTAEYDPLRDEAEAYAADLAAAGVDVQLKRFDGMPHAFLNLGPRVDAAFEAIRDIARAVRDIETIT